MLKKIRNTLVAAFTLALIFGAIGVAYVFLGNEPDNNRLVKSAQTPSQQFNLPKPTKPNAKSIVGASVQSLSGPVKAGQNTSVTVKTLPTAKCTIAVAYDDKPANDSGLTAKTASDYGIVTWSWTVDKTAPAGTWPVKITCKYLKRSAFVQADLKVIR